VWRGIPNGFGRLPLDWRVCFLKRTRNSHGRASNSPFVAAASLRRRAVLVVGMLRIP